MRPVSHTVKNSASARPSAFQRTQLCLAISAMLVPVWSFAAPVVGPNGGVSSGTATIVQNGAVTDINQSSNKAVINWQSFSTSPNETVNFNQPNAASITLNRVIGNEQSVLQGALNATGKVFLVNPNGVLISTGATVNTGGFLASTLNISDDDFNKGNYTFKGNGSNASVTNLGTITVTDGGYVVLMGHLVSNQGAIVATKGSVSLNAGNKVTLNFNGNSLLSVTIDEGALNALVENKQAIYADGGQVILTAKAADELLGSQVNNTGIVQAQTIDDLKGTIEIYAHGGTANIAGKLDASAPITGDGGFIETSGDRVKIADSAQILTRSAMGKNGKWLVDPVDFTIAASGGDMTGAFLSNYLNTQGDYEVKSVAGSKNGNGDIHVNDAIRWGSDNRLTLTAQRDININNAITLDGAGGGLTLNYGGDYYIRTKASYSGTVLDANGKPVAKEDTSGGVYGSITFNNTANKNGLVINGNTYTLIHSMAELDALDKANGVTNTYDGGTSIFATIRAKLDLATENITTKAVGNPTAGYYDPVTGGTVPGRGGVCGATTCFYNPETRQYDLVARYPAQGKLTGYYKDAQGNFTIPSYDLQSNSYYNPATKAYDLAQAYPTGQTIYKDPINGDKYSFNGQKYYDPSSGTYHLDSKYDGKMHYNPQTGQYDKFDVIFDSNNQKLYYQPGTGMYTSQQSGVLDLLYFNPTTNRYDLALSYAANGYYALAKDLQAGGTTYASAPVTALNGVLAGLGHTIRDLKIDAATIDKVGLIGENRPNSIIRDIGLINADVTGRGDVGILVGKNYSDISHVYSAGKVSGQQNVGGLIGSNAFVTNPDGSYMRVSVSDSFSNAAVSGYMAGGLVGWTKNITLSRVHATGAVTGPGETGSGLGGLLGFADTAVVNDSYASGKVSGGNKSDSIGGLIGGIGRGEATFLGKVTNSYASGDVTGGLNVGGLIGQLATSFDYTIENSHASGAVTGSYPTSFTSDASGVGGLIGYAGVFGTPGQSASIIINKSSATGSVSVTGSNGYNGHAGGLVGYLNNGWRGNGAITNSYATGTVRGGVSGESAGGLVGLMTNTSIMDSYATGNVSGNIRVGGLVGSASINNGGYRVISNSYATGSVSGNRFVGSFVGSAIDMNISNSYWKTQEGRDGFGENPRTNIDGSRGLNARELQDVEFYTKGTIDQVLASRAAKVEEQAAIARAQQQSTDQQIGGAVLSLQRNTGSSVLAAPSGTTAPSMDSQIVFADTQNFSADVKSIVVDGIRFNLETVDADKENAEPGGDKRK